MSELISARKDIPLLEGLDFWLLQLKFMLSPDVGRIVVCLGARVFVGPAHG